MGSTTAEFDHENAILYTPKVTAALSFVASSAIICMSLRLPKKRRTLYQRIMCYLSATDIATSSAYFMGRWATPEYGNNTTCSIQGFIIQCNLCTIGWNAALSTNYLVRIVTAWRPAEADALEKYYHLFSWCIPLTLSISFLCLDFYGDAGPWCWIDRRNSWARMLFYIPTWMVLIYCFVVMVSIILHVRAVDRAFIQMKGREASGMHVTRQSIAYISALLLCWTAASINRLYQGITNDHDCFFLAWAMSFFLPMQGVYNLAVYCLPMYTWWQKKRARERRRRQNRRSGMVDASNRSTKKAKKTKPQDVEEREFTYLRELNLAQSNPGKRELLPNADDESAQLEEIGEDGKMYIPEGEGSQDFQSLGEIKVDIDVNELNRQSPNPAAGFVKLSNATCGVRPFD
ncbi:hypothetical protein AAMO2058_001170500 [Amorphochlora amoebiformis]